MKVFLQRSVWGSQKGRHCFLRRTSFTSKKQRHAVYLNDMAECTFQHTEIPLFWEVALLATLMHKLSDSLLVLCKLFI